MQNKYDCKIGFSDHTEDSRIAFAASVLGCSIFERHFTFDKKLKDPDHSSSSEPSELIHYIEDIKDCFKARGFYF